MDEKSLFPSCTDSCPVDEWWKGQKKLANNLLTYLYYLFRKRLERKIFAAYIANELLFVYGKQRIHRQGNCQ